MGTPQGSCDAIHQFLLSARLFDRSGILPAHLLWASCETVGENMHRVPALTDVGSCKKSQPLLMQSQCVHRAAAYINHMQHWSRMQLQVVKKNTATNVHMMLKRRRD